MIFGILGNPYGMNVVTHMAATALDRGMRTRVIDLPSLVVDIDTDGAAAVADRDGVIKVDVVGPYLLFGFPVAPHALRVLERTAHSQNPVDAVLAADDKAATAQRLGAVGVAQVPTRICPDVRADVLAAAARAGYPVVLKRTHGAQGRWVRRAYDPASLLEMFDQLMVEGPGALLVQPLVEAALGTSVRVIVTGGHLLVAAQRTGPPGEWRSNIAGGASQAPVDLDTAEEEMVLASVRALGLQHAGVDLLRGAGPTVVLEVNSCPDFTSMLPYFSQDLTEAVVLASLPVAAA
jgi:ribosomal protein S6--L-glutamate ligase